MHKPHEDRDGIPCFIKRFEQSMIGDLPLPPIAPLLDGPFESRTLMPATCW